MKLASAMVALLFAACIAPADSTDTELDNKSTLTATGDGPITNASNLCSLATQAHPNSIWIPPNYENCRDCIDKIIEVNAHGLHDYCTYNPSNGKTDHHRDN
jgi:hypothetical protein